MTIRQFGVLILGAGGVGKSALIEVRFVRDTFLENYDPTIEERYRRRITVDGETSLLEILDTAGAEQFVSSNELSIRSTLGFVLVFSLTQEASLKEVDNLRKLLYHIKGSDKSIPIVVVATKLDLSNEREVQRSTIQALANRWEIPFYETSAKRDWHITDVFEDLLREMRKQYPAERTTKAKCASGCFLM